MDELQRISQRVNELLHDWAGNEMSVSDFDQQKESFVVGNAFDMFDGELTITRQTLQQLAHDRRLTISA